jgi:hypothetical protein
MTTRSNGAAAPAPLIPPEIEVTASPSAFLPGPGALSSLLSSGDSEHALAQSLIDLQLRLSSRGVKAAVFLQAYGMADLLASALHHRRYMAGDRGIVGALDAVALKKFMKGLSIMLGNK